MSAHKCCCIGHVETITGGFFVHFLVKRLSLLFCLVSGGFLPWQSPWFESAVKPSARELTSVSGCLYHPYLPREGGWVWYDFCELVCCQPVLFEEAEEGGIAPSCTASCGGEVMKISALPGSVLQAGLTQAFTSQQCTKTHTLLFRGGGVGAGMLQLWEGKARRPELGSRPEAGRRGLACLLLPLPGGQRATAAGFDLTLQQQLRLPMGLAQTEQAVWPLSLRCQ